VNADIAAVTPKYFAATISRTSPRIRESPVAAEKKAVLRANLPPRWLASSPRGAGAAVVESAISATLRRRRAVPWRDGPKIMANIASQKKRILRTERERDENRRYTSAIKTYFRRLEAAAESGKAEDVESEFRALVSRIDRAVRSGALHKNTGARKKARAARIRAGASS
jgi:small subunit ribosomal protein S20